MSIESTLKDQVGALVAGGCHNRVNRSVPVVLPYVVFHEAEGEPITGISESYLGATSCEYEIIVYALTPEQAKHIALNEVQPVVIDEPINGVLTFRSVGPYIKEEDSFQYITMYQIWDNN